MPPCFLYQYSAGASFWTPFLTSVLMPLPQAPWPSNSPVVLCQQALLTDHLITFSSVIHCGLIISRVYWPSYRSGQTCPRAGTVSPSPRTPPTFPYTLRGLVWSPQCPGVWFQMEPRGLSDSRGLSQSRGENAPRHREDVTGGNHIQAARALPAGWHLRGHRGMPQVLPSPQVQESQSWNDSLATRVPTSAPRPRFHQGTNPLCCPLPLISPSQRGTGGPHS